MSAKIAAVCPGCRGELVEVPRHGKWLNDEQWAASKAGDWFCRKCPDNGRGKTGLCYWWDREVQAAMRGESERSGQ